MATIVRQRFDVEVLTEEVPFVLGSPATSWVILEWWSAGLTADNDYAHAGIRFLDGALATLSETYSPGLTIDPALKFVYRSFSVEVPDGTRYMDVLLQMVTLTGIQNDGYLDEIKATLHRATSL